MLVPASSKHRKVFKGRIGGVTDKGADLAFGSYGLKALSGCRVKSVQIEAARKVIMRVTKRLGKVWIKIFPNIPVTRIAVGMKMEGGKGKPEFFIARVRPGKILFELEGVSPIIARKALMTASSKLPLKTKTVGC